MIKDNLRVALYARVSGEQQEKEDTIASQLEALAQRIATDGSECEPELHFVDDGCSGYILTRPALAQICISSLDPRGTRPLRRGGRLPQEPDRPRSRAGPATPGPGRDRRVR